MTTSTPQIALRQADGKSLSVNAGTGLCSYALEQTEAAWVLQQVSVRLGGHWRVLNTLEVLQSDADSCLLQLSASGITPVTARLHLKLEAQCLQGHLEAASDQVEWISIELLAQPNERFMGFGERFGELDQRGKEVDLYVRNGAVQGATYKPVPFYISTAGYGLRLQTDVRAVARMATPDEPAVVSIRNSDSSLKFSVFLGSTPKEILSLYTEQIGRPSVPPPWVFGPWKSRDWTLENQSTVFEDITKGRELNLAGSVKLIDALWEPAEHTFSFDANKYPNAQDMIAKIRELGYRLVLWISPWMVWRDQPSEAYRYCEERGYLIKNPQGETYIHRLGNSPTFLGSCFDFTNPEAVAWWQAQIRQLIEMGVDGLKTDFGEQVPEDAVFFDGRTGRELHNIFPRLYNYYTYQAMQEKTDGVLLARSAWDGSQSISAIWAGDQTSDFTPWSGLPSVIRAGQAAGVSGFPYWASDIGGYFGVPTDEVFIRWSQFGAFSPIMQIHGMGNREPWNFEPRTLEIYRDYAQLHTNLFPYIYSYARQASQTGIPLMRPMVLEFPQEPGIWNEMNEHQYCFGAELLVAPVYYSTDRFRYLYLPQGSWRNFWDGELTEGGKVIAAKASLDCIPVFARTGAIIPLLGSVANTLDPVAGYAPEVRPPNHDLRLQIYVGSDGYFALYDGTQFTWHEATRSLEVKNSPVARRLSIDFFDGKPVRQEVKDLNVNPLETHRFRFNP